MPEYEPTEVRAYYRAGHSTLWELADKAGILDQLGLKLTSLEFCESSSKAENALFNADVDFVAGNHITPYLWVTRGKPIVCLASPGNQVRDSLVTRQPIDSVTDLKGKRIADTSTMDPNGGYHHIRGNHMLEIMRGGLALDEVEWVEVATLLDDARAKMIDAVKTGRCDATFAMQGQTAELEKEGFRVFPLETLPMITGPTITTSVDTLNHKDRLGERLVKGMVLTIHFARTHPEEANSLVGAATGRMGYEGRGRGAGMGRLPLKPYPDNQGVANAYELCCMQYPETRAVSPLALWDTHYLRDLDLSGFIDELSQEPT